MCICIYVILIIQIFGLSRSCLLLNFLHLSLLGQKTLSEWTKNLRALIILQFLLISADKQVHPKPAMVQKVSFTRNIVLNSACIT